MRQRTKLIEDYIYIYIYYIILVSQMTSTTTTGTTSTGTGHHKQPILTKKQLKKLKKEEAAKLKKANKDVCLIF